MKRKIAGLFYNIGSLFGVEKKTISILCYHSFSNHKNRYAITPEVFEAHIEAISRHARFVSLGDILSGNIKEGPVVAITIDDGYKDVFRIVPIVKKYQVPVTLFVLSSSQDANRDELGSDLDLLTKDDLRALHKEGFEIGCHSATHAFLPKTDISRIKREVFQSKEELERVLGVPVEYFAYPKGGFTEDVVDAVRRAGYKAAFSVKPGCVADAPNAWLIPRTIIEKTHNISEFPAVYSPSSFWLRRLTDPLNLWKHFLKYEEKK